MDDRAKRIYAGMLRCRLKARRKEHTVRIDSLSYDRIVGLDQQHTQRRAEAIRVKYNNLRRRSETATGIEVF